MFVLGLILLLVGVFVAVSGVFNPEVRTVGWLLAIVGLVLLIVAVVDTSDVETELLAPVLFLHRFMLYVREQLFGPPKVTTCTPARITGYGPTAPPAVGELEEFPPMRRRYVAPPAHPKRARQA